MTKSIRIELSEALHTKVKIKSAVTKIPIAEFVREKLRWWVEENRPIILPTDPPDTENVQK